MRGQVQPHFGGFAKSPPLCKSPRTAVLEGDGTPGNPGYFTGLAIVNSGNEAAQITIQAFNPAGQQVASTNAPIPLAPNGRIVGLLEQLVGTAVTNQSGGYVKVFSTVPVHGIEIFATRNLGAMANVPAQ